MIFYNGFNLLIDMILVGLALYSYRLGWLRGYGAGQADTEALGPELIEFALASENSEPYDDDKTLLRISDLRKIHKP